VIPVLLKTLALGTPFTRIVRVLLPVFIPLCAVQLASVRVCATGADALVLVNSRSAAFADFQHFIQPYLDNFGVPYTVQDISANPPDTNLSRYALLIIGHRQLDTATAFLDATAQSAIWTAVSNGTGLVNFDNDLASGSAPRYAFIQHIFNFGYVPGGSAAAISFPATETKGQMSYVTSRHAPNESITLRGSISVTGLTLPTNATAVAVASSRPLLIIKKYGQGRVVQWASYDWMSYSALGPFAGMDDLVWRGLVWAARKPFVMRSMPNLVTMRVDDVAGPFGWVHIANESGFKPFLALFVNMIDDTEAADLSGLVNGGNATASIHSWDFGDAFFYWNHAAGAPWPDNVISNNFYIGGQWHLTHRIPISRVVASHYSEFGLNAFAGLQAWGVEFFPIEVTPGGVWHTGIPWLQEGPFRLFQSGAGDSLWPLYYADFLTVPGHPEFNGVFFNQYTEVRDMTVAGGTYNCGEFCPDNDVVGSVGRGTKMVRRGLDSLCLATLLTHDRYLAPITGSADPSNVTSNNWRAILSGITNNLASYQPIYVTLDYGCQYARALKTSRVLTSDYNPMTGRLTAYGTGRTDLDTTFQIYLGDDNTISNVSTTIPAFTNSGVVKLGAADLPVPPAILQQPLSRTNHPGTPATFNVGAVGSALSYQWRRAGIPIEPATSSALTLANVTLDDAGWYDVIVNNHLGAVTSSPAQLIVGAPLVIQAISESNGSAVLTWPAIPGISYGLVYKDSLTDADWQVSISARPAQSTNGSAIDVSTQSTQRFFRLFVLP
jgi:hypothetical protein